MNKAQKQKVREEFREKFLMKGSECTWEGYPEPEEVETYLIQKLEEQERELVGKCHEIIAERSSKTPSSYPFMKPTKDQLHLIGYVEGVTDIINSITKE